MSSVEGGITISLRDAITYGGALVGVGIAWASMKWNSDSKIASLQAKVTEQVDTLKRDIADSQDVNSKHDRRINILEKDMSVIRNDLQYIKDTQTEIKDLIKEAKK